MKLMNENIKKFRLEKELTQQEVADKLFVTRQCISRWEQGKSVPDMDSLEKLANILDVSIGDIVDDESIKSLTINEVIKNQKNKKLLGISLSISILAVLLTIFGYIMLSQSKEDQKPYIETSLYSISGIITELNYDQYKMKMESDKQIIELDIRRINSKIYDNQLEEITRYDLKVGDTIEIEYNDELKGTNIAQIKVIDSSVEKSLLGVIFVSNGQRYETIDDIPTDGAPGIRYFLYDKTSNSDGWENNAGLFEFSYEFTHNENYSHYLFEMNIYFDELKINQDAVIGLVYSNGIEYVEILDTGFNTNRTYSGEVDYEPSSPYLVHSIDVTYQLNFHRVSSYSSIDVYEYNHFNDLINITTLNTGRDILDITPADDAIYSYIKVTRKIPVMGGSYSTSKVYEVLLGESLEILSSDEYGMVHKDKLFYFVRLY